MFLPKHDDIDTNLEVIQSKVLRGTHFPVTVREIQTGYLTSPYFKDIYLYLAQNKFPSTKPTIQKVEALVEKYILLDSLLFRITTTPEKETALLATPEICTDKIITLYHTILFAQHQHVIKTYLTINDKFFTQNVVHYIQGEVNRKTPCNIQSTGGFDTYYCCHNYNCHPTYPVQPNEHYNYMALNFLPYSKCMCYQPIQFLKNTRSPQAPDTQIMAKVP